MIVDPRGLRVTSQKSPQLATVFIVATDMRPQHRDDFTNSVANILKGHAEDPLLGKTVKPVWHVREEDWSKPHKGGIWVEAFKKSNVAHNFPDDSKGACLHSVVLMPHGGDAVVDIVDKDFKTSGTAERYVLKQNHFHLVQFNGDMPHRLEAQGPNSVLYGVEIHERDGVGIKPGLRIRERDAPPSPVSVLPAVKAEEFDLQMQKALETNVIAPEGQIPESYNVPWFSNVVFLANEGLAEGIADGRSNMASIAMFNLASKIASSGVRYGSEKYKDSHPLRTWMHHHM